MSNDYNSIFIGYYWSNLSKSLDTPFHLVYLFLVMNPDILLCWPQCVNIHYFNIHYSLPLNTAVVFICNSLEIVLRSLYSLKHFPQCSCLFDTLHTKSPLWSHCDFLQAMDEFLEQIRFPIHK